MAVRSPGWLKVSGFILVSAGLAGCGRTYEESLKQPYVEKTPIILNTGGATAKKLEPLKAKSFDGVLTGKVIFTAAKPPEKRPVVGDNHPQCLEAKETDKFKNDIYDQDWHVGEGGGVGNVVIFLKAPDGTFFPVVEKDKKAAKSEMTIDQPFCAFHPQVVVLYPAYHTKEGKLAPTGQKPVIKNSGAILHNANLQDADAKYGNVGFNVNIPPGTKKDDFSLNPQPKPLSLSCSVHPWMKANIWVFGHPYAVRTNEKGEFTIKNLPTGVDLQLVCWHPAVGYFSEGESAGRKMNFTPGEKKLEIPISPR